MSEKTSTTGERLNKPEVDVFNEGSHVYLRSKRYTERGLLVTDLLKMTANQADDLAARLTAGAGALRELQG